MPDDDFEVFLTADGNYVTTDGELIVSADELGAAGDPLPWMVAQLHDAKDQAGEWSRRRRVFEQLLITAMTRADVSRMATDSRTATIRRDPYSVLDGRRFADLVVERFREGLSEDPVAAAGILAIIAAARDYNRDDLPDGAQAIYDASRITRQKRAWVDVRPVRRRAPTRREAPPETDE